MEQKTKQLQTESSMLQGPSGQRLFSWLFNDTDLAFTPNGVDLHRSASASSAIKMSKPRNARSNIGGQYCRLLSSLCATMSLADGCITASLCFGAKEKDKFFFLFQQSVYSDCIVED